ncbi:hypothetical protein OAF24_04610, partial [bacterium]|nr:hypothetical protein [bacterium]
MPFRQTFHFALQSGQSAFQRTFSQGENEVVTFAIKCCRQTKGIGNGELIDRVGHWLPLHGDRHQRQQVLFSFIGLVATVDDQSDIQSPGEIQPLFVLQS